MNVTAALIALFGPFLVWPLEIILPYPHFVEEIFKLIVVLILIKAETPFKESLRTVIYCGIFFALSESVLYIFKINMYGDVGLLGVRLIVTSLLHSFTFLIIYLGTRKGYKTSLMAVIAAMVVHWFYNVMVS